MADISPEVTRVEGRRVPLRRQAAQVYQGQTSSVTWVIRDASGNPVDLTDFTGTIFLRLLETLSVHSGRVAAKILGSVIDGKKGIVGAPIKSKIVPDVGIYCLEWNLYSEIDTDIDPEAEDAPFVELHDPVYTAQGYLIVNRSLSKRAALTANGPLTIPEIRLHLRDSDPDDNFLIDAVEFDLAEIVACIERAVSYFNESSPPIDRRFTTSSFPYRYNWLNGTVAGLYEMAAHHYRRNSKQIQAQSGVNLNDKEKATEYEQKAQMMWQDYKKWVQVEKVSIGAEACFGGTSECL